MNSIKYLFVLCSLILNVTHNLYAQEEGFFPCINEVSTDPNSPSNNSLPTLPSNEPDERFLNRFVLGKWK